MSCSRRFPLALLALLFPALPTSATAQGLAVYADNSSNGRLLRLDFATGQSVVLNTVARKDLQGLAAREDGLVACASRTNQVVFYADDHGAGVLVTSAIEAPDGPSVDAAGNLYVVSSAARKPTKVWKLARTNCPTCPAGYAAPVLVDGSAPSSYLEDSLVVPFTAGGLAAGDLLVLSRDPAKVLRYPGGSGPAQVLIPTSALPTDASPTGFAFTAGQELLISTLKGRIVRFDTAGARLLPDFANGLGNGQFKLATGNDQGQESVYVASRSGSKVVRFRIQGDGTGLSDGAVTAGVAKPNGVAVRPGSTVTTPAGSDVVVQPVPEVEITFDDVVVPGTTTARIVTFEDNRGTGESCADQNLRDFFPEGSEERTLLPDVVVPCYIRGFNKLMPGDSPGSPTGPETFMLAVIDTTAEFLNTAEFHGKEELRLGWPPQCPNLDLAMEPHTFYAPEAPKGEAPVEEGFHVASCPFAPVSTSFGPACPIFGDISSGCGSNLGRGWSFSLYLTARDTRALGDIVAEKFDRFKDSLDRLQSLIADGYTQSKLYEELDEARVAWEAFEVGGSEADRALASAELGDIIKYTLADPRVFDNATRNVSGEMIARARSLKFFICRGAADEAACRALTE